MEWASKYAKVGQYYGWTDLDTKGNLHMYLMGSAEKWLKSI